MAQEWIETLAKDIKQRNREAAQDYGRAQHYAGIVSTLGKEYFVALVLCLRSNVDALRSQLQGDPTSSETQFETVKADEVKIARARFPWVDAQLAHRDDTIALDYAKALGVAGDGALDRKTRIFAFRVAADDTLFVEDGFAETPQQYRQPEDLARHITEILFGPEGSSGAK
jgi:hypothetical protein